MSKPVDDLDFIQVSDTGDLGDVSDNPSGGFTQPSSSYAPNQLSVGFMRDSNVWSFSSLPSPPLPSALSLS